jgi:hypothetical protein
MTMNPSVLGTDSRLNTTSVPVCFFRVSMVPENDCRPGSFVSNVDARLVLSTSAVLFSKPARPVGISVEVSRVPALSSARVGAAMLAMVGTNATRVLPSTMMSAMGVPPQAVHVVPPGRVG